MLYLVNLVRFVGKYVAVMSFLVISLVYDMAIFVLERDVKLQLINSVISVLALS